MMKLFMLASANIRENKGQSASLIVLVVIATLLLNLGLLTALNFNKSFDLQAEELNSADVSIYMQESVYRDSHLEYFDAYDGVTGMLAEDMILLPIASFQYSDGIQSKALVVMNADHERTVSQYSFVGEPPLTAGERSIYVPYLLKVGSGYRLGDDFILTYGNKEYRFQIAGFTEDIILSTINSGEVGFYLPEQAYRRFSEELNDDMTRGMMLSVTLDDPSKVVEMISDFKEECLLPEEYPLVITQITEVARSARVLTAGICSVIIVAVAIVIVFISLIVIRFRIDNSIEDGMANIGALKSCGFTSLQIMGSIMLQFSALALAGGTLGTGMSYCVLPILSDVFSVQSGLIWRQGFDSAVSISGLLFILLIALFISWFSARRVSRLHPIIALRGGLKTHNFRKNHLPLDRTRGNLHMILSWKRVVQNLKQHGSIALIIAAVAFVAAFGMIMYDNFVIHDGAIKLIAGECPDVHVSLDPYKENRAILPAIADMPSVSKAIYYDSANCAIEGQEILVYVAEDFEQTESEMIYEGRHPKHDNEIAINGYLTGLLGKKPGDMLTVAIGGAKAEYLVTGLLQTSNYLGMDIEMTFNGVRRLQPEYQMDSINVYLSEDADLDAFISELQGWDDPRISNIQDFDKLLNTYISAYASIVNALVIAIMAIIALVILLILYLVIKTMILREKRALGVQKAVGFTTGQLMRQVSLVFLPSVLIGVILGGITGYFATNPVLTVIFKSIGIAKVNFTISPLWVVVLGVGIILFAYTISMLISWRIREISAYALISE